MIIKFDHEGPDGLDFEFRALFSPSSNDRNANTGPALRWTATQTWEKWASLLHSASFRSTGFQHSSQKW
jgi:hypothetical protein